MKKIIIIFVTLFFFYSCDNDDYGDYLSPNTNCFNPSNDAQDETGLCCPSESLDCNGLCYGLKEIDDCGICGGNNISCTGCVDPQAYNYNPNATIDDGSCSFDAVDGWYVEWSDEFNDEFLSDTNWEYQLGDGSQYGIFGWGNNEQQYYTDSESNIGLTNCDNDLQNCLYITAFKQDYENMQYTSARIKSKHFQTYGKIEIRAKLPVENGTWPAIWMLPENPITGWPTSGEIDIMEHVGCDLGSIYGSIHCNDYNHNDGTEQTGGSYNVNVEDFHVYAIEWDENYIKWFIDGNEYFAYERPSESNQNNWPFNDDFHLILNIAVGGDWGTLGGTCPINYNAFPQSMLIDYVRFFKKIN